MQSLLGRRLPKGKHYKGWIAVTEYLCGLGFLSDFVLPFIMSPSKDDYLLSEYTVLKSFPALNTFQLLSGSLQIPALTSRTKHLLGER